MKIYEITDGFAVNLENIDVVKLEITTQSIEVKMKNSSEVYIKGFTSYDKAHQAYSDLIFELQQLK